MGFIFAILFLICILWAIFYFELSRLMATAIIIFASLFAAIFISPWSLLLGLPLIILSLIVVINPLRKSLITQPAYKALAKAMPSMSSTEREALDAGTSWWEKELFMGAPD